MIKFRFPEGLDVEVWLEVSSPHSPAPIQCGGNPDNIEMVQRQLRQMYGAFGHSIGDETTAIDLSHAMSQRPLARFRPELVEGAELVQSYDTGIPDGAKT